MAKKTVFGLIGAGMIAEMHMGNIIKDGRADIKWICDVSEEVVNNKKEKFNVPCGTTNYKEILADEEVNTIIICTPPHTHKMFLFEALEAGKNVLVEKPLCINSDDIDEIVNKVSQYPEQVVMECSARYTTLNPRAKFIKQMIADGKLGDIYYVHQSSVVRQSRPGIEYNPGAYWFLDKEKAGAGPILDWGVYDLAFLFEILGGQPEVKNMINLKQNGLDNVPHGDAPFTVEEHGVTMIEFDNGLKFYHERSTNAHNEVPSEIKIYGTKGGVTVSYEPWLTDDIKYYFVEDDGKGAAKMEIVNAGYNNEPTQEFSLIKHFIDCIEDGVENTMTIEKCAKKMKLLLKMCE